MDFPWNELKNIGDAKGNTQGSYQSMCVKSIPIGSSHFGSTLYYYTVLFIALFRDTSLACICGTLSDH